MKKIRTLAILNGASFLLHLLVAVMVQFRLLNSKNVAEISNQYPALFTPAPVTFSIWIIIYITLAAFCNYHLIHAYRHTEEHAANKDVKRIGYSFFITNIATVAWLIVWTQDLLLWSLLFIFIQLITLFIINLRLNIYDAHREWRSKLFTQFPLSLYFGWIAVATIANLSVYLIANNRSVWDMSQINWTITMIAVCAVLTVWLINRRKNVVFGLVIIWAFYGIILKRTAADAEAYQPIIMVAWGGMCLIAAASLFGMIRNIRRR